jgi:hypothetical protein
MKHLKTFENFSNTDINEEIDFKALAQKIGLIKDPVKKKEETLKAIQSHPVKNKTYQDWLKKDKQIADKYVEFWMNNTNAKYCRWDDVKKKFVDTGISRDASGILGTKSLSESKKTKI